MNLVEVRYYIIYCFALLVLLGCFSTSKPPADQTLIEIFHNQPGKFETLVDMFLDDTDLQKVASNFVLPGEAKISRQRLQEYRQLLKETGLQSIERGRKAIFLTAYASGGFPDDGTYKGYVYFPAGLPYELRTAVADDLDGLQWHPDDVTELYRKIDEKWYLWFLA